jgi:putative ABC transport system permease protein
VVRELAGLALGALLGHRLRSGLSMLGIAIGIASVILLTSVGEGTRVYTVEQFTQFGTNLMQITPGRAKTFGVPGVLGGTTHKLTIDDATALQRVRGVERVVPVAVGMARVEAGQRGRSVYVYGVTPDIPAVWQFHLRLGRF